MNAKGEVGFFQVNLFGFCAHFYSPSSWGRKKESCCNIRAEMLLLLFIAQGDIAAGGRVIRLGMYCVGGWGVSYYVIAGGVGGATKMKPARRNIHDCGGCGY